MSEETIPILPMAGDIRPSTPRGQPGTPATLPVSSLRIDGAYQRSISAGSARNIRRICAAFDWSKFLPVIVVENGETYDVIDGQHRATAAATLGLEAVPAYILACSRAEAAAAFAAINGNVTPVAPVDIWFAELAAGVPEAAALQSVFDAAEVRVVRKKDGFAVGETRAISVLKRAHAAYGSAYLTTILQCITQTGNGNPGVIAGAVVNGIGKALITKPELMNDPAALFDVFDGLDLAEMQESARIEFARTANPVQFILTRQINAALRRREAA